jgi:hypothetical protein
MNTLFFKSLPQIAVAEMCGDLPSTDVMFEAANQNEYEKLIATQAGLEMQSRSLKDLVTLFLGENWPRPDSLDLTVAKTEHLMSVIFGHFSDSPHMCRLLLITHSPSFNYLGVAHLPRPAIYAPNSRARNKSVERALASRKLQQ